VRGREQEGAMIWMVKKKNVMWDDSRSFIIKMKILVHDSEIPVTLGSLSA
jgi:hypothetical protein